MKKIELGMVVRDKITGFKGVATSRCEFLNGCVQVCVKPKMKEDGKFPEGEYIDVQQLEILKEDVGIKVVEDGPGGPGCSEYNLRR